MKNISKANDGSEEKVHQGLWPEEMTLTLNASEYEALESMRQMLQKINPPKDGSALTIKALISDIIKKTIEDFFKKNNVVDDPDYWKD